MKIRLLGLSKSKSNKIISQLSQELNEPLAPAIMNPFNRLCKSDFYKYIFAKYVVDILGVDKNKILIDTFSTVLVESEIFRDEKYLSESEYQALQKMYVDRLGDNPDPDYFFYIDCTMEEMIEYLQLEDDSFISSVPFALLLKIKQKYDQWFQTATLKKRGVFFARISSAAEALQIIMKDVKKEEIKIVQETPVVKKTTKMPSVPVEEKKDIPKASKEMKKEVKDPKLEVKEKVKQTTDSTSEVVQEPKAISISNKHSEIKQKIKCFNSDNEMAIGFMTFSEMMNFKSKFDNNETLLETRAISYFEKDNRFYSMTFDGEDQLDISDYTYLEDALESLKL